MRSDGIVEDRSANVKSNCFSSAGVKCSRVRHPPLIPTSGRPMRSRAFLLFTAFPIALSVAPSVVHSQTYVYRDCRDRYSASGSRYYACSYDPEMAARARADAARARAEAREDAARERSYAQRYASVARADARAWDLSVARAVRLTDARIRADEARFRASENSTRAREHALEARERSAERARDRARDARERAADRARDRRYYNRW